MHMVDTNDDEGHEDCVGLSIKALSQVVHKTGLFHCVINPVDKETGRELDSYSKLLDSAKLFSADIVLSELVILIDVKFGITKPPFGAMPSEAQVLIIDSPVHDIPIGHDNVKSCKEVLVQGIVS